MVLKKLSELVQPLLAWPAGGQKVLRQSRQAVPKLCCVHVTCCHPCSSPVLHPAPWCHSGVHPASVLKEGHVGWYRQTHSRGQGSLVGLGGRQDSCSQSQPPPSQGLTGGVVGPCPGALSSCCVCASFFCAPHRCYEKLLLQQVK